MLLLPNQQLLLINRQNKMMKRPLSVPLFVLAVVLLPLSVFALVRWYENRFDRLPVLGKEGHRVAAFELQDHHGNTTTLSDWKGKIVVADFFFTHCPVVCPKMTRNLRTVQQAYPNDTSLLLCSFSVDPERDSVGRLMNYARQAGIGGNWKLITGDKRMIYSLARSSFLLVATEGDGGPDDFIHSEKLVLVDPDKRIRGFYKGTDEAEARRLISDIKKLRQEYGKK